MNKVEKKEKKKISSFQINQTPLSNKEFYFTGKDTFFGFKGEADLIIKTPPLSLTDILAIEGNILLCQNIHFHKEELLFKFVEQHFVRFISMALGELYRLSLLHQLPGVLILISQEEIDSMTELQRNWLRDFFDLFTFIKLSPKGIHQLYMPTSLESVQHYDTLHALLENNMSSPSSLFFRQEDETK